VVLDALDDYLGGMAATGDEFVGGSRKAIAQDIAGAFAICNAADRSRAEGVERTADWTHSGHGRRNIADRSESRQDLTAVFMQECSGIIDAVTQKSGYRPGRVSGVQDSVAQPIDRFTAKIDDGLRCSTEGLPECIETIGYRLLCSIPSVRCRFLHAIPSIGCLFLYVIGAVLNPTHRIKPAHWNLHQFQGNADMASQSDSEASMTICCDSCHSRCVCIDQKTLYLKPGVLNIGKQPTSFSGND
jgi:hypothetical protein